MPVAVQSYCYGAVPEPRLDHLGMDVLGDEQPSGRVVEVMKAQGREASSLDSREPRPAAKVVSTERPAVAPSKDEFWMS